MSNLPLLPMRRRTFLSTDAAVLGSAVLTWLPLAAAPAGARHLPGRVVSAAGLSVSAKQGSPFGWTTTTATGPDHPPLVPAWSDLPTDVRPARLRFTIGLDERDDKIVEVRLPESGRVLGTAQLRTVSQFQVFELSRTETAGSAAALAIGVRHGWLGDGSRAAAQQTLAGLQRHPTADGLLGGVSPSNKAGKKSDAVIAAPSVS